MRMKWIPVLSVLAAAAGGGIALASHVTQVDPATVPTGFLASHNASGHTRRCRRLRPARSPGGERPHGVAHASGAGHRHRRARLAHL
jgi:hypothetical protein